MMNDPTIMRKIAHVGLHSYSKDGGGSAGTREYLRDCPYPDLTFWMTEFNEWCPTCDSGTRGNYDWTYCRGTAEYLLGHLANGASAGIVWEGYDSYYAHPPATWSFWGLFAVDDEKAQRKSYTPRKNFFTLTQVSRFIRPGARRVAVLGRPAPLSHLLAFQHATLGQLTIVGINSSAAPVTLRATLTSLPQPINLTLYYTSATTNLARGADVVVREDKFTASMTATIPADCVFTLATRGAPPSEPDR